jgi:hypothetical protein
MQLRLPQPARREALRQRLGSLPRSDRSANELRKAVNAEQAITLRTGNAGGIRLTLNGEDLGTMGGVGEVVERTWIVDQGEVSEAIGPTPTSLPTATPTATPSG